MKKSPFAWPFAKHRQLWIDKGDRGRREAGEYTEGLSPALASPGTKTWRAYRRAARLLESSADNFQRAGMGAMASLAYREAVVCWSAVADEDRMRSCEIRARAINTYYQEIES